MSREVIFAGAVALVIGAALVQCTGCKPAESPLPAYCYDDKQFTDAVVTCAKTAPTKAASQYCRKTVHAACGIAYTVADGGEP